MLASGREIKAKGHACVEDFLPGSVTNYLLDRLQLLVAAWPDSSKLNTEAVTERPG